MTTRRKFMMIAGGGIVAAATGLGGWAGTRDPQAARAPWEKAGREQGDVRRFALSYAVLAPNPHNRQPWVADLSVPGEIGLHCELERRLPATDPFDRQITIGLGCFSELLVMAAATAGNRVDAQFFPDGEPMPRLDERRIARFRFIEDPEVQPDPLFAHVLERRSNKEAYDPGRPVEQRQAETIVSAARSTQAGFTVAEERLAALRPLSWDAMERELRTPPALQESLDLMRIGKAEINANPDGIDLPGPFFEALYKLGLLSRSAMADTQSSQFRQQIEAMRPPYDTAMGYVWLVSKGNQRSHQIAAGRDYLRLNLAATAIGVDMHPLSQALQEYPEMQEYFAAIRQQLGVGEGDTLQMFSRIGHGPAQPGSPRWDYETRIRGA